MIPRLRRFDPAEQAGCTGGGSSDRARAGSPNRPVDPTSHVLAVGGQPLRYAPSHRSVTTADLRGGGRTVTSGRPDHEADFDDFVRGHLASLAGFGRLLA